MLLQADFARGETMEPLVDPGGESGRIVRAVHH